jgi:outer membrane protein assembly factor BamA
LLDSGLVLGSGGGYSSGIGLLATWDSRNDNLYPTNGGYYQFSAISYGPALGSEFAYNCYLVDLRQYASVFGRHILALQGVFAADTGSPPFQAMNQLGVFLRGYTQSRFEDKSLVAFQTEYRLPLSRRFGLVGFVGCGEVARSMEEYSLSRLKTSTGFGIRFALIPEQKVNLRIDLGIGKDDSSFDITLMEFF